MAPAWREEFLDIQATTECGFTLKRVGDMKKRYSHVHCTDKYSEHSPTIRYVWPTGWVFVYELSGFGFQSSCSHLNFRFRGCLEQGAPRCWRNDRVQIQSEAGTSHDQMHQTCKYSEHSPIIWSVRPNGWGVVYELSRSCFESSCSHFSFSYRVFLEQRVPWHWRNYRVWIHCETPMWHDKSIQSNGPNI